MSRRRLLVAFALVVVLLLVVVLALVTTTWDSPGFGGMVLARAAQLGGVEIEASEFRLALLDGLRLGDVHAVAALPAGRVVLDADAIVLEHQVGPLLRKQLYTDRIVLERPRMVLEEVEMVPDASGGSTAGATQHPASDAGGASATPPEGGSGFRALVREVRLVDATFQTKPLDPDEPPLVVEGFDLELHDLELDDASTLMTSLRAVGEMTIETITTADAKLADGKGKLVLGDGDLTIQDLDFEVVDGGPMTVPEMKLHLTEDPLRYEMDLRGNLDLEGMLGVDAGALGKVAMVFEGQGPVADVFASVGGGRVEVAPGTIPDAALFRTIDTLLGEQTLVGSGYDLFDLGFELRDRGVIFDGFDIGTENVGMTITGRAGLDATIALVVRVRVPRDRVKIKEVPPEILDILEDDQGRVVIPFAIGGASFDPDVKVARDTLFAAAKQGARREVEKRAADEIGRALGRLLGGGDGEDG